MNNRDELLESLPPDLVGTGAWLAARFDAAAATITPVRPPLSTITARRPGPAERHRWLVAAAVAAAVVALVVLRPRSDADRVDIGPAVPGSTGSVGSAPATAATLPDDPEPGWTVNPSIAVRRNAWQVRVEYDPALWSFSRFVEGLLPDPNGMPDLASEGTTPVVDAVFEGPDGKAQAEAWADSMRGQPGIRTVEVHFARGITRPPGTGHDCSSTTTVVGALGC